MDLIQCDDDFEASILEQLQRPMKMHCTIIVWDVAFLSRKTSSVESMVFIDEK